MGCGEIVLSQTACLYQFIYPFCIIVLNVFCKYALDFFCYRGIQMIASLYWDNINAGIKLSWISVYRIDVHGDIIDSDSAVFNSLFSYKEVE